MGTWCASRISFAAALTTSLPMSVAYLSKTVGVPKPFGTSFISVSTKLFFKERIAFHGIFLRSPRSFHIWLNSGVPTCGVRNDGVSICSKRLDTPA